jgi:hypothetical protein
MPNSGRAKEKIAVVLPSRGLVFSKTVEELLTELKPYKHKIFWSHGRPIPDCFEIPTTEALTDSSFTHLLTVEEDMIIPKGSIKAMLAEKRPYVAYDYPVTGAPSGTVLYDTPTTAYFTGCGLMLVEMDIVRRMPLPIWRTNIAWNMKHRSSYVQFDLSLRRADYGQQDIAFGLRLYANQIPLYVMPKTIGQRKLVKQGKGMTNEGCHEIKEYYDVTTTKPITEPHDSGLVAIKTPDGKIHYMYGEHAKKLVEQGRAELITIGNAEFYNLDIIKDWLWLQ